MDGVGKGTGGGGGGGYFTLGGNFGKDPIELDTSFSSPRNQKLQIFSNIFDSRTSVYIYALRSKRKICVRPRSNICHGIVKPLCCEKFVFVAAFVRYH